jgi:hypothetical protein
MIPENILEEIRAKAAKDCPGDYVTQKHVIDAQIRAWEEINEGTDSRKNVWPPPIDAKAELRAIREELRLPTTASGVGILMEIRNLRGYRNPEYAQKFADNVFGHLARPDLAPNQNAEKLAELGGRLWEIVNIRSQKIKSQTELEALVIERNEIVGQLNEAGRFLEKTQWKPGGFEIGDPE